MPPSSERTALGISTALASNRLLADALSRFDASAVEMPNAVRSLLGGTSRRSA